jgi:hypothetical protein
MSLPPRVETLEDALAYARTYWTHGTEPATQRALTILAAAVPRHCHADGAGPCLAGDCPIAGQRPRACPGAAGPQHPATPRT